MSKLTVQERQEKLEKLAEYAPEVLSKSTVKELRELAKGLLNNVSSINKTDLVLSILDLTKDIRQERLQRLALEAAQAEAAALAALAATKTPSLEAIRQANLTALAPRSLADYCKDVFTRLLDVAKETSSSETKMIKLGLIAEDYYHAQESRYKANTIKTNISDLRESLKAALEKHQDRIYYDDIAYLVQRFNDAISIRFAPIQSGLKLTYRDVITNKNNNLIKVNFEVLLNKAIKELQSLTPDYPLDKKKALNVAIAVGAVTGRRLSEVFSSGTVMEVVDDTHVAFKGQLKARHDATIKETPYKIPVLCDSTLVVSAMEYLSLNGLRLLDNSDAIKNKYAKEVSRTIKKYEWNAIYDGLTFKDLRNLYASKCLENKPDHMTTNAYIGSILGHSPDDVSTANTYQKFMLVVA